MGTYGVEWQLWIWIAVVGLLLGAAVVVAATARARLDVLAPQHIAAATIVGLLTWGMLMQAPMLIMTVTTTYAGIDQAPNKGVHQAFVALNTAVVAAGVLAIVGLLRRQAWAVVLGIAVCAASIGGSLIAVGNLLSSIGGFDNFGPDFPWFVVSVVLQPVPAIVGIVLLLWPFVRAYRRPLEVEADARGRRDDGIIDADSEEVVGVEWPDWSAPASDQR